MRDFNLILRKMPQLTTPNTLVSGYLDVESLNIREFDTVEEYDLIIIPDNVVLKKCLKGEFLIYALTDINENYFLAILRLKKIIINEVEYYQINKSKAFIQRKGYATILYEYAFCYSSLPIISDKIQTKPGSSELWKTFQKKQETKPYEILVLNTNVNTERLFTARDYSDYDIWGWDEDFLALSKEIPDLLFTAYEDNNLSKELYDYILEGIRLNKIKNKKHIYLIGKTRNIE